MRNLKTNPETNQYLLLKDVYGLIVDTPSRIELRKIDEMIRGEVKILRICESTNMTFMYAPKRKGGLGLVHREWD